jgi:uncharacterized protein
VSTRDERWPAGTPSWVDLATSDREAAWGFYGTVFGWKIVDTGEEFGHYGMAEIDGRSVAGLAGAMPGDPSPPHWTTYLASDDADATAGAITANGGTVVFGPTDIGEQGRMLVASDPTGAFFGVWQAGRHIGATLVNEPGAVVWNQLNTGDVARAREFYAAVFGYTYQLGDDGSVTIDGAGPGGVIGGMSSLDGFPPGVPPHWGVFFSVADADASAEAIAGGGGQVQSGPMDMPFGRMAVAADPQGAVFAVISEIRDPDQNDTANPGDTTNSSEEQL